MLPAELARQVRLLEISARHLATEVFAGEYSSAFKGRGIEFAEVREYQPGDDVRAIDWNVTARAGRPFIKRFNEERELTIMLAVDLSASGRFGTEKASKQELAAEVAALLAFAAVRKGDRVGLVIFTDRVERYIPPKKGSRHILRLIRELLAFEPQHPGTKLSVATEHIMHVLKRTSVVFVVSDFLDASAGDAMRTLAGRHDVVALHVEDPREHELPSVGLLDTVDPETGEHITIDTSNRGVRRAYTDATRAHSDTLERTFRQRGIDTVHLSTGRPYVHDLVELFRVREHRR